MPQHEDRDQRARENRTRRAARRRGLVLQKSRCRTPEDPRHGRYMLSDERDRIVAGGEGSGFSLNLDDVEAWLFEE